jgi:hypothetical protein
LQVTELLNILKQKDAAYSVDLAWAEIMPMTNANCWKIVYWKR